MVSFAKPAARFGGPLRTCFLALATAASLLPLCSKAEAEEVFTSQAAAADATDTTWIPAPAQRAAVCIVDSGVDMNPDTTNVVARFAIDGGDPGDVSPDKHGTLMAMIASAPYNGFGMVGAAPSVNVVSVRAMRPGASDTFGLADIVSGIQYCQQHRTIYSIRVVLLSLGAPHTAGTDLVEERLVQDTVDQARRAGLDVVAAAGNRGGAVDWPAAYNPTFAVAASDSAGQRCSFASSGPEVDLWVPGCPQDVSLEDGNAAWASGSSESTAFLAGVLAELRGLRPDLGPDAAERVIEAAATRRNAALLLNAGSAYEAAGLAGDVSVGRTAMPGFQTLSYRTQVAADEPPPDTKTGPQPAPTTAGGTAVGDSRRLPTPRVRSLAVKRGVLRVALAHTPSGLRVVIQVFSSEGRRVFPALTRTVRFLGDRIHLRVSGRVRQVSITYESRNGSHRSPRLVVQP